VETNKRRVYGRKKFIKGKGLKVNLRILGNGGWGKKFFWGLWPRKRNGGGSSGKRSEESVQKEKWRNRATSRFKEKILS